MQSAIVGWSPSRDEHSLTLSVETMDTGEVLDIDMQPRDDSWDHRGLSGL